jgi:hypothetical protein
MSFPSSGSDRYTPETWVFLQCNGACNTVQHTINNRLSCLDLGLEALTIFVDAPSSKSHS